MTAELSALVAIVPTVIGVCGFYAGRTSAAKKSGEAEATVAADIRYIKESIDGIRRSIEDQKNDITKLYEGYSNFKSEAAVLRADVNNVTQRVNTVVDKTLAVKGGDRFAE